MKYSLPSGGPVVKNIKSVSLLVVLSSLVLTEYSHSQSAICNEVFQAVSEKAPTLSDLLKINRARNSKIANNLKVELLSFFATIENQYGPLDLKSLSIKLDWEALKTKFLKDAGQVKTSNDQYYLIARLLHALNDAHVSVTLPSTLEWSLPVQARRIGDRLFVSYVNDQALPRDKTPDIGDELVGVNRMSIKDFQAQFSYFNSAGNDLTNQTLFGRSFTKWSEKRGMPLSEMNMKSLEMTFRNHRTGSNYTVRIPFEKTGVGLIGQSYKSDVKAPKTDVYARKAEQTRRLDQMPKVEATLGILEKIHQLFKTEKAVDPSAKPSEVQGLGKKIEIGAADPFFKLPESYKALEMPEIELMDTKFFKAGTFERDGKKVGFLRIPSYSPEDLPKAYFALKYVIKELQANSEYLVIDQTSNPGGYVILSDLVTKSLVGKFDQKKHLHFSVRPSQKFLTQYSEMMQEIQANADGLLTPAEVKNFVGRLKKDYARVNQAFQNSKKGKSLMSTEVSLTVMSEYMEIAFERSLQKAIGMAQVMKLAAPPEIQANVDKNVAIMQGILGPQVYTKEVYMMINELDFSGGDATPATLRDYDRVVLIGERTAGAGGTVEEFSYRANSEIEYSLTTSLMVRKDGSFVENFGVHPDIHLTLNQDDIMTGYQNFFERNLLAIDQYRKNK